MRIQNRLLLSILPVVFFTVIAVTTIAIFISKDALEEQVKDNAQLLSKSYSSQVSGKVSQLVRMAEDLSAAIETAVNVETVLINTTKRYSEIGRILYTSLDGSVKDMAPYNKTLLISNFSTKDEWQESYATQRVILSNPSKYLGEDVFFLYSPVTIDYTANSLPTTVGIAVIVIPTNHIFMELDEVRFGKTGFLFITNGEGSFIYHKEKSYIMDRKVIDIDSTSNLSEIQSSMLSMKSGVGSYYAGSERRIISFSPIEDVNWSIALSASYAEFTKKINKVFGFSILILFIGLSLSIFVIYMILKTISKPIVDLSKVADQISSGDYSVRSSIISSNEVGHLSTAFNTMVDRIENYNQILEQDVLSRTKELLAMNEELEASNEALDSNAREMEVLNEELQSTNETLDSNARDMEAMNEELKSANENMEAINEELLQTIDELDVSNKTLAITRDALWSEMELAHKLQTVLLPSSPRIPGIDISAFMVTANSVGGDYYDVINVGEKDWFLIGDVSGHGVTSGLIMMMVQTSIHVALSQNPEISPVDLLTTINKTIHSNISKLGGNRYMTLTVFACLDNYRFSFAGAHLPLIIYRKKSDVVEFIETPGAWVGLVSDINTLNNLNEFVLDSGDSLMLYTDGMSEAVKDTGELYSQKGLAKLFKENIHLNAKGICDVIKESSANLTLDDDVTIMVLKRE